MPRFVARWTISPRDNSDKGVGQRRERSLRWKRDASGTRSRIRCERLPSLGMPRYMLNQCLWKIGDTGAMARIVSAAESLIPSSARLVSSFPYFSTMTTTTTVYDSGVSSSPLRFRVSNSQPDYRNRKQR
ncbi:hypothetical protein HN011_000809 [Eciton burchellii]|nr:hypothetical protein HN011_000809 [Eciton burchellii]